jgi:hypothetical protein
VSQAVRWLKETLIPRRAVEQEVGRTDGGHLHDDDASGPEVCKGCFQGAPGPWKVLEGLDHGHDVKGVRRKDVGRVVRDLDGQLKLGGRVLGQGSIGLDAHALEPSFFREGEEMTLPASDIQKAASGLVRPNAADEVFELTVVPWVAEVSRFVKSSVYASV